MKPLSIKEKALYYRKKGYSYNMISEKLGLAKSTLSDWLKEIPYQPNRKVISRIKLGRQKTIQIIHGRRVMDTLRAKKLCQICLS